MNWYTEKRKIEDLKSWESNPRTITKEQYNKLKDSIDDLGNFEPLVINTDGTVLAGNQRLRVHLERGDKEVEVSVPERELTEEEIKKIGLISNRHSGEWDMDKLANEFEDTLDELGFDDLLPVVDLDTEEDGYKEPEDLETTVVLGDVYQLGEHRLMCGDSTKIEDVEKLMDEQKADMVFTDPPYGIDYSDLKHKFKKIENDNSNPEQLITDELCARAIEYSSKRNETVVDLFGGSGSTLIACEQTNRRCYMMELDPHYCQVIIDRWEKLTGEKAVKLKD